LKDVGVKKGDAVVIYLPMLMELPIAMLACARIGAVHSVQLLRLVLLINLLSK
jgi:acetyl-CoA synthetase